MSMQAYCPRCDLSPVGSDPNLLWRRKRRRSERLKITEGCGGTGLDPAVLRYGRDASVQTSTASEVRRATRRRRKSRLAGMRTSQPVRIERYPSSTVAQ